ncbi:uncharacterized protein LOC119444286 [Dermacentor silvarum]|uniref:uncharacterized protein LOC119440234 n=1 Tax=Dermacentor silvarum TaxID=543639 RepID=UPI002100D505|nr:uncharacterized protein LOC119440234 [Dermacentor silvarum]XP_037564636.2 uncharacterized protein LOC119444286 [Dermacentor silvarum]
MFRLSVRALVTVLLYLLLPEFAFLSCSVRVCLLFRVSMSNGDGVNRGGGKTGAPRFVYTREERELLRNLVVRYRAVIENRKTDNTSKRAKDSAWEKLTEEYNSQPGIRRVTVVQLRKLWDNEKSKWKKKDSEEKRDFYATGGGPPTCRPMSPSLALVGAAASHIGTRLPNPYDSDGSHMSQPVMSLPPARTIEVMVTGNQGSMDEWLEGRIGKSCWHVVACCAMTACVYTVCEM